MTDSTEPESIAPGSISPGSTAPDRLSGPSTPANAAELARYLPLSQRPRRDETAVTGNWSTQVGLALLQLADLLGAISDSDWGAPSVRPGFSVSDVAGFVVWRTHTPRLARARERAGRALRDRRFPPATQLSLGRSHAAAGRVAIESEVRSLADDVLGSSNAGSFGAGSVAARSVADLAAVVLACYDISSVVGRPIVIDPIASGAVALARSLSAHVEIRAVLATTTLVSRDGDWRVGKGTELTGSSAEIILFLYGRAQLPSAGA